MKTRKDLWAMGYLPVTFGLLHIGPASQVCINVSPLNAEAHEHPARLMIQCQAIADKYLHTVRFTDRDGVFYDFHPLSK